MGESVKERKEKNFYPDYLAEIIVAVIICLQILLVLSLMFPPSIGRQIDFTAPFKPMPEWYFLWLYKLMYYFPGKTAFIGTVIIPVLSVILLLMIPYIDRGKYGRLKAIAAGSILLLMFLILTLLSVL
jgi:quinol-cytochrome oxidoreductase complex cytochrome b subunit